MGSTTRQRPFSTEWLKSLPRQKANDAYDALLEEAAESAFADAGGDELEARRLMKVRSDQVKRHLVLNDLFFLLTRMLHRQDLQDGWLYDRVREFEADPDEHLDLWARGHYKSTIITYAGTIQEILRDPEITVGIFSFIRPIAKSFLRQIKREFTENLELIALFPDILWDNPKKDAPKWSEDDGIIVKRKSNPKEATVEAWGLVDGQPVSRHFRLMVYDDVITDESVSNPEMILKITRRWELSENLKADNGRARTIGTRYHYGDTYGVMMERGVVTPRIYPATHNGKADGRPVFLTEAQLAAKARKMGPYVFACQMLQNPKEDEAKGFKVEWYQTWPVTDWQRMNRILLCDPASKKKKESDYTAMWVIGFGADRNVYVIDGLNDRLNLKERGENYMQFHRMYAPLYFAGYEEYGLQADIEYIEELMERENYRFKITPMGGKLDKNSRIEKLIPWFSQGRVYLPGVLYKQNYEKRTINIVNTFHQEQYMAWPFAFKVDMLDCLARFAEAPIKFPITAEKKRLNKLINDLASNKAHGGLQYDPLRHGIGRRAAG